MDLKITLLIVLLAVAAIIWLTSKVKLQPFFALFIVSVILAFFTIPPQKIISTIKEGFGSTMASIGFLILFGSAIGVILDHTGATLSIAGWILGKTGKKRSTAAIGITGFITGLPIFCDSGYIVLSGLARSFSRTTGVVMPLMATVLATSLYSVHCLIPPHPGATAAAALAGVDPGKAIVAGILFAIPGALSAYFWSRLMVKGKNYSPDSLTESKTDEVSKKLPGVLMSFMPIVVPLLLITLRSVVMMADKDGSTFFYRLVYLPGDPVFALFIGVLLSLLLLRKPGIDDMNRLFNTAVEKAGPILIITAAGGMFGMVIKSTGAGEEAGRFLSGAGLGLLAPFLISAILKTAQGSSTVAIITAASLITPMLDSLGLDSTNGRLFALLAMGAGSMMVSHANDSYFWVISKFSGIDTSASLRVYSTSTIVMSLTVFIFIWLASLFML